MKKVNLLLVTLLFCHFLQAKEEENHTHEGKNNIKINYEVLDFTHSLKKEEGKRYGIELDHEDSQNHYQFYYEETRTDTTKIVPKDLDVKKYTMKYQYKWSTVERVSFIYTHIDDKRQMEVISMDWGIKKMA